MGRLGSVKLLDKRTSTLIPVLTILCTSQPGTVIGMDAEWRPVFGQTYSTRYIPLILIIFVDGTMLGSGTLLQVKHTSHNCMDLIPGLCKYCEGLSIVFQNGSFYVSFKMDLFKFTKISEVLY